MSQSMGTTLPCQYHRLIEVNMTPETSSIGVVLAIISDGSFKIGVEGGILKGNNLRTCFSLCSEKHLTPEDVPDKTLSLREATKVASGGGQGLFHCDCKKSGKQCIKCRCICG